MEAPDEEHGYVLDRLGAWSERKISIVEKYAKAYIQVLRSRGFKPFYIDGFTGGPLALRKDTADLVVTTAKRILEIDPPFDGYYLVDADPAKSAAMRAACQARLQAIAICGDANEELPPLFAKIRYSDFKRALCFLDPYKILLSWDVLKSAGAAKTIEAFIHFPTQDIQRNVLRNDHSKMVPAEVERMNQMWGDDSWKEVAYVEQKGLFWSEQEKQPIDTLLDAFAQRLKKVAGFKHVSQALPMRNSTGAILYHLMFATQQPIALRIASDILKSASTVGV
jgi:three-Cys-motif partner protein